MKTITVSKWSKVPWNYTGHVIHAHFNHAWFVEGKRHKEDGPALILKDLASYWYICDKLHREDGPAIIPAIIYDHGVKFNINDGQRYYLNDIFYTKEDYYRELYKRGIITQEELFIELL